MINECIKYLESVSQNYKTGIKLIPKEELKNIDIPLVSNFYGSKNAKLLFITAHSDPEHFLESPEGELLQAAIQKGMKLTLDDVGIYCASRPTKIEGYTPTVTLILGRQTGWDIKNSEVIQTEALPDSLTNQNAKKQFWHDLQLVMTKL